MNIDFAQLFITFAVLLFSLTVHEAAHAWTADRLGDATARMLGRVSLNPAVHIDPIGTVVFPLMAMFTGVPLLGWAKPVPVNILNLHGNWRERYMLIAAAGPISNLILALVGALVLYPINAQQGPVAFIEVLQLLVQLNVLLAVFNMLPIPPLDGGNVLTGLVRGSIADQIDRLRPYGFLILYALMLTGVLWRIVGPVSMWLISVLLLR